LTQDEEFSDARPSKSQRKRDADALTEMGEELLELKAAQLAQVPLPDDVRAAIDDALAMTSHGARRRQKLFIGKLLREVDPAPIRAALDTLKRHGHASATHFHEMERWRERLIGEGDAALNDLLERQPRADRNRLRQLIRTAQKEQAEPGATKSARALFRYLRELFEASD
jgi:ribosome-associated protein